MAFSSRSHLYSSKIPQGKPCTPIPQTYTEHQPTSKILICKKKARERQCDSYLYNLNSIHLHDSCGTVLHNLSHLVCCSVKCVGEGKALFEQEVNIFFYFLFSPVCSPRPCLVSKPVLHKGLSIFSWPFLKPYYYF